MMHACLSGNVKLLKRSMKNGGDLNQTDEKGRTPLMACAQNDKVDCAEILIQAGASVNAKDKLGKNAIMYAALHSGGTFMDLLFQAGGHVNARSHSGVNSLGYFILKHSWQLKCHIGPIWKKYFSNVTCQQESPPFTEEEELKMILKKGSEVNRACFLGREIFLPNDLHHILMAAGQHMSMFCKIETNTKEEETEHNQPCSMKQACRDAIRQHLIKLDKKNLFLRVPQLGLPNALSLFLLFEQEL